MSAQNKNGKICRICHSCSSDSERDQMLTPCGCKGSLSHVHSKCLIDWVEVSKTDKCEVCLSQYNCIQQKVVMPTLMSSIKGMGLPKMSSKIKFHFFIDIMFDIFVYFGYSTNDLIPGYLSDYWAENLFLALLVLELVWDYSKIVIFMYHIIYCILIHYFREWRKRQPIITFEFIPKSKNKRKN